MDGSEQYSIKGITGVDVRLPIAGPGSRSYAFIIDWHIRVLIALAWLLVAMYFEVGGLWRPGFGKQGVPSLILIFLVPFLIYFLYHPVLELLMRGQSPGKRIAKVRVVTLEGGTPGSGAVIIRNVFRLVDSLPSFYFLGLLMTFFSARRVRIGDMAAGTMLIADEGAVASPFDAGGVEAAPATQVDFAALDLAGQILERWNSLSVAKRGSIARALLTKLASADQVVDIDALDDAALRARLESLAARTVTA